MMNNFYYECEDYDYKSKYFVKYKKNINMFKETRKNHLESYTFDENDNKIMITDEEYLVVQFQNNEENQKKVNELFFGNFSADRTMAVVEKTDETIEVAIYLDYAFKHCFISKLKKLGFIKLTWLEIPKDKTKGTYFVNAEGVQIVFNLVNAIHELIWKSIKHITKKFDKKGASL